MNSAFKMHILVIAPGKSAHTKRFIEILLSLGYAVTLLDALNPFSESARGYGFVPYPTTKRFYPLRLLLGCQLEAFIYAWFQSKKIKKLVRQIKPDITHLHYIDKRACEASLANVRPLVLTAWGSDINDLIECPTTQPITSMLKKSLQKADFITGDTVQLLDRMQHLAGCKLNMALFYFGIDFNKFKTGFSAQANEFREKNGIPKEAKILLSVRAMRPKMGHHHVLKAFAYVRKKRNDVILVFKKYLPFKDGYENHLYRLAEELQILDHIIWLDASKNDDMPANYAMADIVINYPEQDGFPVSFIEAAACKRPVVTCDLEAYHDIALGDCFWVSAAKDPKKLANSINECLDSSQFDTERKVNNAFCLMERIGNYKRCFENLEKIYQSTACRIKN